jgi:hypothetical protein
LKKGRKYWKLAKEKGFCANPFPKGVIGLDGKMVQFNKYADTLKPDQYVLCQCRFLVVQWGEGRRYFQAIPTKIKVFSFASIIFY